MVPTMVNPGVNCLIHRPPPRPKHCVRRSSAADSKEGGRPPRFPAIQACHWSWVCAAAWATSRSFVSWVIQKLVTSSTLTARANSRYPTVSAGSGTGFARGGSRPIALRAWAIRPTESVIWQVAPFLRSSAHVYLPGMQGPSSRSLLYGSGLVQAGLEPGAKGLIFAFIRKFSTAREGVAIVSSCLGIAGRPSWIVTLGWPFHRAVEFTGAGAGFLISTLGAIFFVL